MKKITYQDIFDAAWQAFIVEGKPPAIDKDKEEARCKYLTDDGRKCAIGLVLPDGHPAQRSKKSAYDLVIEYPELWDDSIIDDCDEKINPILNDLQTRLHDSQTNINGQWIVNLRERYLQVAEDFDLTVPE